MSDNEPLINSIDSASLKNRKKEVRFHPTDSTGKSLPASSTSFENIRGPADDDRQKALGDGELPPFSVSVLQSVMITLPLLILYGFFDYAVYKQFGFEADLAWGLLFTKLAKLFLPLATFVLFTSRYPPGGLFIETLYFVISSAAGSYFVHIGTSDSTLGGTLRSSGLAVLWIYVVLLMNKWTALVSCIIVGMYYIFQTMVKSESAASQLQN